MAAMAPYDVTFPWGIRATVAMTASWKGVMRARGGKKKSWLDRVPTTLSSLDQGRHRFMHPRGSH